MRIYHLNSDVSSEARIEFFAVFGVDFAEGETELFKDEYAVAVFLAVVVVVRYSSW